MSASNTQMKVVYDALSSQVAEGGPIEHYHLTTG